MLAKINGFDVAGVINDKNRCPSCRRILLVRNEQYTYTKDRGTAEFDNGDKYIKCRCGKFVMLKGKFN